MKDTLSIYKNPDNTMSNNNVAHGNFVIDSSKLVTAIIYGVINACDDAFTGEKAAYDAVMQLLDSEWWAKLAAQLVLHYMIHETDKCVIVQSISREIANLQTDIYPRSINPIRKPLVGPQIIQPTNIEPLQAHIQYKPHATDHCAQSTVESQTTQYRAQPPAHQMYDYFAAQDQYQRCITHYAQQVQHNLAQRREAMDTLNYGSALSRRSRGL